MNAEEGYCREVVPLFNFKLPSVHLFSLYRVLEREILAYLPFIYIFCVYLSDIGEISIF